MGNRTAPLARQRTPPHRARLGQALRKVLLHGRRAKAIRHRVGRALQVAVQNHRAILGQALRKVLLHGRQLRAIRHRAGRALQAAVQNRRAVQNRLHCKVLRVAVVIRQ